MTQEPGAYAGTTYTPDHLEVDDPSARSRADQAKHVAGTAKDQAAEVGSTAKDAGGHVAGVAQEQAKNVASEAAGQVRNIAGQAGAEARQQAAAQTQRAAEGLHSIGDQLKSMAGNAEQSGVVTDLTHEAADRVHEIAGWLDQRDSGAILTEVKDFARRRPGTFLLVAAGAGLVAGRLTRGLTANSGSDDASSSTPAPAAPAPTIPPPAPSAYAPPVTPAASPAVPTTAPGGFSTPVAPVVEPDPFPVAPGTTLYPEPTRNEYFEDGR